MEGGVTLLRAPHTQHARSTLFPRRRPPLIPPAWTPTTASRMHQKWLSFSRGILQQATRPRAAVGCNSEVFPPFHHWPSDPRGSPPSLTTLPGLIEAHVFTPSCLQLFSFSAEGVTTLPRLCPLCSRRSPPPLGAILLNRHPPRPPPPRRFISCQDLSVSKQRRCYH